MSELLNNITADMVKKSLDIVALEHKLITSNIANINSQDRQSLHVDFDATYNQLRSTLQQSGNSINVTDHHLDEALKDALSHTAPTVTQQSATTLDQEMSELTKNKIRYEALIETLKKLGALNSTAIRGNR